MDKDENLFEDLIDEDDDLLNISLDELSGENIEEPVSEEPDEDIIELIDLLEKGDADLLAEDDDTDVLTEDDISSEELTEGSNEENEDILSSDLDIDDLLLDSDISSHGDEPVLASDDDLDKLLSKNSPDDPDIEDEENDITDVELEDLLDDSEAEDLGLEIEDILDESSQLDESDLLDDLTLDEAASDEGEDELFEDLDLLEDSEEDHLKPEDETLDVLSEEPDSEASDSLLEIGISDLSFDEADNVPPEGEFPGEPVTENDLQEEAHEDLIESAGESPAAAVDGTPEDKETGRELFFEESSPAEESVLSEDFNDDSLEGFAPAEEELPAESGMGQGDGTDAQLSPEPDAEGTSPPDVTAAVPQIPLISEEKVEEIVRDVVGEVVGKIAREVFAEVAEKVITEAIDSLKKSLGSDSE